MSPGNRSTPPGKERTFQQPDRQGKGGFPGTRVGREPHVLLFMKQGLMSLAGTAEFEETQSPARLCHLRERPPTPAPGGRVPATAQSPPGTPVSPLPPPRSACALPKQATERLSKWAG